MSMLSGLKATAENMLANVKYAMENPFGIDFEMHANKVYIPLGSAFNCLGYNDFLERIIGVSRTALGLIVLATAEDKKTRITAAGQVFRGVLEMAGSFEGYLLILDIAFTIYNLARKAFPSIEFWPGGAEEFKKEVI